MYMSVIQEDSPCLNDNTYRQQSLFKTGGLLDTFDTREKNHLMEYLTVKTGGISALCMPQLLMPYMIDG